MAESEREAFRRRVAAAQVELPDGLVDVLAAVLGPLVAALDALADVDLGCVEPFDPTRLAADPPA
jgi:hypothetical protein